MSDKTFQWSLTGLTALVIVWIILGILFYPLPAVIVFIVGLLIELAAGGYLLHKWGRSYTERSEGMVLADGESQESTADLRAAKPVVAGSAGKEEIIPKWQVTTTTFKCDKVDRGVTVNISAEWIAACEYHNRWGPVRRQKKTGIGRALAWFGTSPGETYLPSDCPGSGECPYINDYRNELYEREIATKP